MTKAHWKKLRPTSLSHAMELCLEHARHTHNRSVDRVADLMGLTNKWIVYKWVESGRIPGNMIRPFAHACGIDYVTRYLAHTDHKLLIDIPTGRKATHKELNELQRVLTGAIGELIDFYAEKTNAEGVIAVLDGVMTDLAWHRRNVEKYVQPELDLTEAPDGKG